MLPFRSPETERVTSAHSQTGVWTISASDGTVTSPEIVVTIDATTPTVTVPGTLFTGDLSSTDLYINKVDNDAATQDLITAPTGVDVTYQYAVITSTTTCNGGVTFSDSIPQTDDISTDNTYQICVKGTDVAGNAGYGTSPVFTRDITIPTISSFSGPSGRHKTTRTPDISFTPSEAGTTQENASCGIPEETLVANTEKIITLNELSLQSYPSCTLVILDAAGNPSVETGVSKL